jgi:hypothetical protein
MPIILMINFFKDKIRGWPALLGAMFVTLFIGLIIGAQWYRLYIFPFPQLNEWKSGGQPYVESSKQLVVTIYSKKTPIFLDRLYFDSIGDNRLEGLYLLQMPRHYSDTVRIKSSKDLIVYRATSDNNNNIHYENDNWELSDILINIKGQTTFHTKIIKKLFPANNIIELDSGGPISSDPIFIKLKDYVAPSLKFKIIENI